MRTRTFCPTFSLVRQRRKRIVRELKFARDGRKYGVFDAATMPSHQPTLSFPVPRLWAVLRAAVCLCLAAHGHTATQPPSLTVTTTPATASSGPVVKLEGHMGSGYTAFDVADDTTFDLTGATLLSRPIHPTSVPFTAGNQPQPPKNMRILGGVVDGAIPLEWTFNLAHAFGGSAFLTVASGLQIVEGARIHNVQDGWRPRETPEFKPRSYPNTGRFLMRDCYMTGIRDDCIENDEFMPGVVENCLFDGVATFLSEQNETINGVRYLEVPTIGPDEDPTIQITRALVRLAVTSGEQSAVGTWFKMHGYKSANHRVVITDSVFATDTVSRNSWKVLNFPKDATFQGTNYLLWLGTPGAYRARIPDGVTFLEGPAAKDKWNQLRNAWLVAHGYEPRTPEDLNPMETPVAAPTRKK